MYSNGPPHMAGQKQDEQLEHTYSSYVRIRDVAMKTCHRWWTIGRMTREGQGYLWLVRLGRIGKRTGRLEKKSTNRDNPNNRIIKIDQNTGKSPGDLRRLDVTQTLVRNHQLIFDWKIHKIINDNNKKKTYWDTNRSSNSCQKTRASNTR